LRRAARLGLLAGLLLGCAAGAAAETASSENDLPFGWANALKRMFDRAAPRYFVRDPVAKRALVDAGDGLLVQLSFTGVGQYATQSLTDRQGLANLTSELAGARRLFEQANGGESLISWWLRAGDIVGAPDDTQLQNEIGSVFAVNGALERKDTHIQELYWGQYFAEVVSFSLGRVDPSFRYDYSAVANDERTQFLADPFVNSTAIPFPDPGIAFDLRWAPDPRFAVRGGIHQDNQSGRQSFDLHRDELFYAVEPVLTPSFEDLGDGNYRFLAFYSRKRDRSGAGVSLSFDQELGGGVTPFVRLSVSDSEIADFSRFASAGLALQAPFARPEDVVAIAWAWGDPTAADARDEQLVELYYRAALNQYVEATPNLQLVINPGRNPQDDLIGVFGFRLQATF